MVYAITGVSGRTGSVAAETLLAGGQQVRVVVRDAAKGATWKAKGAEVAVANLADPTALASALAGAAGAYLLVPPNLGAPSYAAYQQAVSTSILDAVRRSAVPHVVLLSSVGAELEGGTGPIKGLRPLERGLLAPGGTTRTTAVRAAYFMENLGGSLGMLAQGLVPAFHALDVAFNMVATRDIGTTVAQALREGATQLSIIELAGPRKYSINDVAAALSTLTGREIRGHQAPIEAMIPTLTGFGFSADLAALYREMTEGFASGRIAFEGTHRTLRGGTPLEAVLRDLLAAPGGH